MNIEVKIVAPDLAAALNNLAEAIAGRTGTLVSGPLASEIADGDATPGKKVATRARAAAKAEPTGSDTPPTPEGSEQTASDTAGTKSTASEQENDGSASDDQTEAPAIEYSQIKKAVVDLSLAKGRDATIKVLTDFDVPAGGKADQVPEERWPELLAALQEAAQ